MKDLTIVQEHYKQLVSDGRPFKVKGQSLICNTETFPISMAKHLGLKPRNVDRHELERAWNKY